MGGCTDCQHAARNSSKIHSEILDNCLKNQIGRCPACSKLREIDGEIEKARCALDSLLRRREEMITMLNEQHDPFAQQLPVEIASRIFSECMPYKPSSDIFHNDFNHRLHVRGLFTLGQIGQRWRSIARSTPQLWTICCAVLKPSDCTMSVGYITDWLRLSGGLDLFVNVVVYPSRDVIFSKSARSLLASASRHASRWRALRITVPCSWLQWMSHVLSVSSLVRLEDVILDSLAGIVQNPQDILQLKASPYRLELGGYDISRLSMDYSQLTHFSYLDRCISLDVCIQLLKDAPHLSFVEMIEIKGTSNSTSIANNSSLRTLKISSFVNQFWDVFSLPSLKILEISRPHHNGNSSWVHMQQFLRRSGCKLEELVVDDEDQYKFDLVEVLKLLPHLEKLRFQQSALYEPLFSLMDAAAVSSMTTTTPFLGNLRCINCETCDPGFNWTWLVVFLTTITSMPEHSLRNFGFQYAGYGGISQLEVSDIVLDRNMLQQILQAVKDLDYKILLHETDLGETLRNRYELL